MDYSGLLHVSTAHDAMDEPSAHVDNVEPRAQEKEILQEKETMQESVKQVASEPRAQFEKDTQDPQEHVPSEEEILAKKSQIKNDEMFAKELQDMLESSERDQIAKDEAISLKFQKEE